MGELVDIRAYPPGTTALFEVDANGNFTGDLIVFKPDGSALDPPQQPVYSTTPSTEAVIPQPGGTPGEREINITVTEAVTCEAGDPDQDNVTGTVYSTGEVSPAQLEGWQASYNAKQDDDLFATDGYAGSGYSDTLTARGFKFEIPEGSTIVGIKVRVRRNMLIDGA